MKAGTRALWTFAVTSTALLALLVPRRRRPAEVEAYEPELVAQAEAA